MGRLLELQFLSHIKTHIEFQNMQFQCVFSVGVTLKILWGLTVGKNNVKGTFQKYQIIIGRLLKFKFFRHVNTNTDFKNMQFKAISVTLKLNLISPIITSFK